MDTLFREFVSIQPTSDEAFYADGTMNGDRIIEWACQQGTYYFSLSGGYDTHRGPYLGFRFVEEPGSTLADSVDTFAVLGGHSWEGSARTGRSARVTSSSEMSSVSGVKSRPRSPVR